MTIFLDSAIFMYAAGSDHPLRTPCRRVLERAVAGDLVGVTSAEVIQEIVHRYLALRKPDLAAIVAREVLSSFGPVIPVLHSTVARLPALVATYPQAAARDLLHLATCAEEGIAEIVTPDRDFDAYREIRRIAPEALA